MSKAVPPSLPAASSPNAAGDVIVQSSWIHSNSAGAFSLGGGIYNSGNLRVDSTTISGNTASFGGGVFSRTDSDAKEATLITNSTISGNTAFVRGGGVRNALGRTTIEHSTITGNQAPPGDGGGVASRGYATSRTEVRSTIIAGNTGGDVDFGTGDLNTFMSLDHNLIGVGNAIANFDAAGDQSGVTDPKLGPLAHNGGSQLPNGSRLLTHALLPGSPAINAGNLNAKAGVGGVPLFDQRGEPFARIFNGRIDIGAFEFQEPSDLNLQVDTLVDESDENFGPGDLSLREALELANMWPSPALASGIISLKGALIVSDHVTVTGPGAKMLTIDAAGYDPTPGVADGKGGEVFLIDRNGFLQPRIEVVMEGLTLTGGE
jgi:hypothetical protein